jgi:hypothetical protein
VLAHRVAEEVRAALAVADDEAASPVERAEMLMEIALGLQQRPKTPDQLHAAVELYDQHGIADKGDNRWGTPQRDSLCWPYNVSASGDTLVVADSGNNRVLLWEAAP